MIRKFVVRSFACSIIVFSIVCVLAAETAMSQSISSGRRGIRIRDRIGQRIGVGRSGVRIQQGHPAHKGSPLPAQTHSHGIVIENQRPGHTGQGYGRDQVITHQNGSLPPTVNPRRIQTSGNFIATNKDAQPYQRSAEAAFKSGDYKTAVKLVKRAIRKDRQNGSLRLFASHVQFAAGDYEEAADELESATETLPQHQWDLVIRNVQSWGTAQNYQAQKSRLLGYLKADPNSQEALVVYGFHASQSGQRQVAANFYTSALQIDPDYTLAKQLQTALRGSERSHRTVPTMLEPSRSSATRPRSGAESMIIRSGSHPGVIISSPATVDLINLNPEQPTSKQPVSVLFNGPGGTITAGDALIDFNN